MIRIRATPLYGNCIIQAPDGSPLCRVDKRRIQWYLDRNLGEIVYNDPTTLRLTFEPSGRDGSTNPYNTSYKENICVVCGTPDEITRHHVVPYCFRKHFPKKIKDHSFHDILPLCIKCHDQYEKYALELKSEISQETGFPLNGIGNIVRNKVFHIKGAVSALLNYDKIPIKRREELLDVVRDFLGKQNVLHEDLVAINDAKKTSRTDFKTFGQMVVEDLDNIDSFIIKWRTHFVLKMNPKHLPRYWNFN